MRLAFLALLAAMFTTAAVAQSGYRVQPGDVLAVEVLQDPSLNREVLVLPDGSINFPFAGSLPARGQSVTQIQDLIAQGIAPNFRETPDVFVTVRQLNPVLQQLADPAVPVTMDIYILGEVVNPGPAAVPPGTTFMQALSFGGGFTNFAAQRRIQLRRVNPHTGATSLETIDFRAISDGATLQSDPVLQEGDVILVPQRRLFE